MSGRLRLLGGDGKGELLLITCPFGASRDGVRTESCSLLPALVTNWIGGRFKGGRSCLGEVDCRVVLPLTGVAGSALSAMVLMSECTECEGESKVCRNGDFGIEDDGRIVDAVDCIERVEATESDFGIEGNDC